MVFSAASFVTDNRRISNKAHYFSARNKVQRTKVYLTTQVMRVRKIQVKSRGMYYLYRGKEHGRYNRPVS